ncbi:alpha-tocopherol transfer protein-like [Leptinotarsa decemlineata]|uniref:alpha-tocopherol transfer protein-like n=1 Tax=Leptinotarsa decemlineata TaxID=7539 RepID=UPI000C2549DB|nr:uncharacterized protein LOC111503465 [Leptinotarsa decemlineata]
MTKISKLLQYSESEKRAILKHYNISEKEFEELVEQVREWFTKSSLPQEHFNNDAIKSSLLNCKMSLEKSKKTIQGYFTVRTLKSEFFNRFLPNTEGYEESKTLTKVAVMPRLSPDLCRITVFRMDDPGGKASDGLLYAIAAIMQVELRIRNKEFFCSNILIIDLQGFHLHNLMKFTPTVTKTLVDLMLAINLRLKNIHLVNLPPFLDKIMIMLKMILPSKFFEKVRSHTDFESLYDFIPKEYLPSNYGGDQASIEQLHEDWCQEVEKNEDEFKKLLGAKCQILEENDIERNEQFGVEGSFRKLTLD